MNATETDATRATAAARGGVALIALAMVACGTPAEAPNVAGARHAGGEALVALADLPRLDPAVVGRESGREAQVQPDGVVRIGWSRDDVLVQVDGAPLPPAAGLGSWAAFAPMPNGRAMVMGDTVVFEDEVDAAMDAAFLAGLEITALHNHFFFDSPNVYFMHIGDMGELAELARGVGAVWDSIAAVRRARPQPAERFGGEPATEGPLDFAALNAIVGGPEPQVRGGVVKFTIARDGSMHGVQIGGSMGLTTWAAFNGSDTHASIDGDFIMTAAEAQPVLRALRANGLHVVALHNHMIGEQPSFIFTHFWGTGPATELARAFHAVLDAQRAASSPDDAGGADTL